MYGSEPRLSTVIPSLSKFNNRLKAPSLIVFISQVSLIMDYVFGLFLILAYLFGGKNGIPKMRCKKRGGVCLKKPFLLLNLFTVSPSVSIVLHKKTLTKKKSSFPPSCA